MIVNFFFNVSVGNILYIELFNRVWSLKLNYYKMSTYMPVCHVSNLVLRHNENVLLCDL